jgi:hypothetical protein
VCADKLSAGATAHVEVSVASTIMTSHIFRASDVLMFDSHVQGHGANEPPMTCVFQQVGESSKERVGLEAAGAAQDSDQSLSAVVPHVDVSRQPRLDSSASDNLAKKSKACILS